MTMRDNDEIKETLEKMAWNKSYAFCYHCYVKAIKTPEGIRCPKCFSDDLMRLLPDDGPEWGIEWVVKSLIQLNFI